MGCCFSKSQEKQSAITGELNAITGRSQARTSPDGVVAPTNSEAPLGQTGNFEWTPIAELTDEFGGSTLDSSKWLPQNPTWKGRAPGWFNPQNVSVNDGRLELVSKVEDPPAGYPEQFNTFSTSFVRSQTKIRYGYVQAMVQVADSITSSAFWFVQNTAKDWNEIDVFELSNADGETGKYHMNMHVFRKDNVNLSNKIHKSKTVRLPGPDGYMDFTEKPFVAGLERTPDWVIWYVNGAETRREPNTEWHGDMWVQFDSETMGNWFGLPSKDDARLPAVFTVHEVRTWTRDY